ncbi:hypothetical protein JB92DRAFT_3234513 [Gautieria morchelliformis]|nr:hypothetical protein JB92DRAFT_3234513 [Gautieria morchelliformis]
MATHIVSCHRFRGCNVTTSLLIFATRRFLRLLLRSSAAHLRAGSYWGYLTYSLATTLAQHGHIALQTPTGQNCNGREEYTPRSIIIDSHAIIAFGSTVMERAVYFSFLFAYPCSFSRPMLLFDNGASTATQPKSSAGGGPTHDPLNMYLPATVTQSESRSSSTRYLARWLSRWEKPSEGPSLGLTIWSYLTSWKKSIDKRVLLSMLFFQLVSPCLAFPPPRRKHGSTWF